MAGPLSPGAVLVTGCGGFLGGWTVRALADRGVPVLPASHDPSRPAPLLARLFDGEPPARIALPATPDGIAALVEAHGVALVLHLAGQSQVGLAWSDPPATLSVNAGGTAVLLEGLRRAPAPPAMVLASTDGVYGAGGERAFVETDPVACATPYECTKAAAELMVRAYASAFAVPAVIARFGNVYGPGDGNRERIVPNTVSRALRGERPVVRDGGDSERTYLHVEDAVAGLLALAAVAREPGERGAAYNLCGESPVTTLGMIAAILAAAERTDLAPEVHPRPPGQQISRKRSSPARLMARTGWAPSVPLADGLARVVAWERDRERGEGQGGGRGAGAPAEGEAAGERARTAS